PGWILHGLRQLRQQPQHQAEVAGRHRQPAAGQQGQRLAAPVGGSLQPVQPVQPMPPLPGRHEIEEGGAQEGHRPPQLLAQIRGRQCVPAPDRPPALRPQQPAAGEGQPQPAFV
ncbi:MAG: hypothetical protein ACK56I_09660, partial [bacterium]